MSSYGDCTYGATGGTYGDLCGTSAGTGTPGGGWLHRGPYRVRVEGTVELRLDDDEVIVILAAQDA